MELVCWGEGAGSLAASEKDGTLALVPTLIQRLFLVWQEQVLICSMEFKFKFRNLLLFLLFYEVTHLCLRTFALLGLCRLQKAERDCMDRFLHGTLSNQSGNLDMDRNQQPRSLPNYSLFPAQIHRLRIFRGRGWTPAFFTKTPMTLTGPNWKTLIKGDIAQASCAPWGP